MTEIPARVKERILARIAVSESGCWIWQGARFGTGYGHIGWQEVGVQHHCGTHRALFLALGGKILAGYDLDHLCRQILCCNPSHLEPVTRRTNLLRGKTIVAERAARTHCPAGHEYTPANTRISHRGTRRCRQCDQIRNRASYWKNVEGRREYNRAWRARRQVAVGPPADTAVG